MHVDVRIVAATHRQLDELVENGLFRQDLFYRLNIFNLALPPLRERPEDIPLLARHFLARSLNEIRSDIPVPHLSGEATARLLAHRWPGNIRELRNLMTRLAVRLPAGIREIDAALLAPLLPRRPEAPVGDGVWIPADATLEAAERLLVDAALERTGHNRGQAARQLGIGERTLRRRLNHR